MQGGTNIEPMKAISLLLSCFLSLIVGCRLEKGRQLFTKKESPHRLTYDRSLADYTTLELNQEYLGEILAAVPIKIKIDVPYGAGNINVDLERVNLFSLGFKVMTDQGQEPFPQTAEYYTGTVHGEPGSVVSVALYQDQVTGFISSPKLGTLNIGKAGERMEHIIFDQAAALDTMAFSCGSPDAGLTTPELEALNKVHKLTKKKAPGASCLGIDFELTHEAVKQFGSAQRAAEWFLTLFSGVKALYQKEGINLVVNSLFIWTTPDGYSPSASTALNQIKAKRSIDNTFTGALVHLVRVQTGNLSGIAYLGTACNKKYRYGFSAVTPNYATYPAFSWSTEVLTHELGHNLGSPHTQWCGWPGGALDNCYYTEGGCPPGPAPVNGGTIMSYCHMTKYGINFANGFGPRPLEKIKAGYENAPCACIVEPEPCVEKDTIYKVLRDSAGKVCR